MNHPDNNELKIQENNTIFGIHSINDAIEKDIPLSKVFILRGKTNPRIEHIIQLCKEKKIQFFFQDHSFFKDFEHQNHQGILAHMKQSLFILQNMDELEAWISKKKELKILALDRITDTQNLGAISRSAYFFGIDLILMEKKNSAPINETTHKVSSGASLSIHYALINSLRLTLNYFRSKDIPIYISSLEISSTPIHLVKKRPSFCLVMGSEEKGVRTSLIDKVDEKITIMSINPFNSLNVSVSTGIILQKLTEK